MNDLILEAKILKHSSVFLCHFPYQPQKFSDALLLSTIEKEFQREGRCCVSLGFPWGPNLWDSIWLIWRASFLLSGWRLWGRRTGAQLFLRSPQRLNIPHSCPRGGCPVWRSPLPRRNPEAAVLCALPRCVVPLMSSTPPQWWPCLVFIYTGFFFSFEKFYRVNIELFMGFHAFELWGMVTFWKTESKKKKKKNSTSFGNKT